MRTYSDYSGGPSIGWLTPPTPVVKRLLIINGAVFLLEVLAVLSNNWAFFRDFIALSGPGIKSFMLWQFVTYMFLHSPFGIFHILINLLVLWMFGRDVEYELGPVNFLKMYILGGIVGGLLWLAFNFSTRGYVLGASGAILSVVIAFATLFPERPITILVFFILPITMKAKWWAWITVAFVSYGCLMMRNSTVADLAHLGGIIVGYLYVKWLGFGHTPAWIAAIQRAMPRAPRARREEGDEFHSSRPGVPFNHPYRSFEDEELHPARKKGLFGRVMPTRSRLSEPEQMDKEEFIQKQIDPILDKIAKHGMQSLTRKERKILESARERMGKRK